MSSPFLAAVGGARGTTGPQGPPGAPGANGLSLDLFLYKFSAAITGTPAAGFLRLDSAPATATRLVVATVDASGRDQTVPLQLIGATGSKIRIQLRANIGSYVELSTTGPPVAVVGAIEWPVASAVVGPVGAPLDTNEIHIVDSGSASGSSPGAFGENPKYQCEQSVRTGCRCLTKASHCKYLTHVTARIRRMNHMWHSFIFVHISPLLNKMTHNKKQVYYFFPF